MSDAFFSLGTSGDYRYVDRFSKEYPDKLQMIKDPPAGIYVRGKLPDPEIPTVAIVGSRICSQYGRLAAEEFGRELAQAGVQVVSGLARGIDGISQSAACEAGGKSFGVLGCGVNVVYPLQNRDIYEQVLERGGLISEVAPDAPPIGKQFASRNRIISALSDLVLVIEAKERSGTGITVAKALEQGKDVFALPGRIHDICSAGCNRLIAQGAGIATGPESILEALGMTGGNPGNQDKMEERFGTGRRPAGMEDIEWKVYRHLDYYPVSANELAEVTRLGAPELANVLFHLQMRGFAAEEGRGQYVRTK